MILADSGVFIAAANAKDRHHSACADLVRSRNGHILVSPLVIAEVSFMIGKWGGTSAKAAFLDSFASGSLILATLTPTDISRMAEVLRKYAELDLDAADASIIALAERLRITTIATVDHRDFTVVRPLHTKAFDLVP